jgi:hypothetical protein
MNTFRIFIFTLLALAFNACTADDLITMQYQMTQCADPWMADDGYFSDKEGTLKWFLEKKGVGVESLSITENCPDAAVCNACVCAGCDLAVVKIKEEDEAILKELGFKRI